MSVSYGTAAGGSGNEEKVGIELLVNYYTGANATGTNQGTTPTSATSSAKVTANIWVWTKYSFSDGQTLAYSSGWTYLSGAWTPTATLNTPSNSSYSTSNKVKVRAMTRIYNMGSSAISSTMTGTMSGLYCNSSARPTKTLTLKIPAIPSAGFPTLGDDDYDFGMAGMLSFSLTGDVDYTVKSVTARLLNAAKTGNLIDFDARQVTTDGTRWYVIFSDGERDDVLAKWVSAGVKETTSFQITVITTVNNVDSSPGILNIDIPLVAQLYGLSSIFAQRSAFNALGDQSTSQIITLQASGDADASPWQQAGVWPTSLLSASVGIGGAYNGVTYVGGAFYAMTYVGLVGNVATYTYTDNSAVNMVNTKDYGGRLFSNAVQIDVDGDFVLPANSPVFTLYKDPTTGEKRVGINTANPLSVLDVRGNQLISGTLNGVRCDDTGWKNISLIGTANVGWTNYSGSTFQYRRIGGMVCLRGAISPNSSRAINATLQSINSVLLPAECCPTGPSLNILQQGSGICVWMLTIDSSGLITASRYRDDTAAYPTVSSSAWLVCNAMWVV